jgi:hypothetical protein
MSVNARSDVNAAAYWEMLFHNGSGWERLGFQRVHNNAQPTLGVGVSLTQILDRDRTWLGDCRLALNVHIDSGGGWIAAGPTSMQVSFLTNTA